MNITKTLKQTKRKTTARTSAKTGAGARGRPTKALVASRKVRKVGKLSTLKLSKRKAKPQAAKAGKLQRTKASAKKRGVAAVKYPGKSLSLQALFARKPIKFEYQASERVFLRARPKGR